MSVLMNVMIVMVGGTYDDLLVGNDCINDAAVDSDSGVGGVDNCAVGGGDGVSGDVDSSDVVSGIDDGVLMVVVVVLVVLMMVC